MFKALLAIPRHILGYVFVISSLSMAYIAHWVGFIGALLLDHEMWWKEQDEAIKETLNRL